jgi:methyl-accepting chemotaxis protein
MKIAQGITSDFSLSGVQLRIPLSSKVAIPKSVEIDIKTPYNTAQEYENQKPLRLTCDAVWNRAQGDNISYGLEFLTLTPEQRKRLEECFSYFNKPAYY